MTVVIALSGLTLVNMGTAVLAIGTTDGLTRRDITDGDEIESKNICHIRLCTGVSIASGCLQSSTLVLGVLMN